MFSSGKFSIDAKHRYQQAHKPILEQESVEGHSVRAMYLLAAVADLARIEPAQKAAAKQIALHRLWANMVDRKMYLTGGIGAIKKYEGFGIDYFLPQGTDEGGCYSETCAAIGVMMLAERLLQVSEQCILCVVCAVYFRERDETNSALIGRFRWCLCRYHGTLLLQCCHNGHVLLRQEVHLRQPARVKRC